MTRRLAAWVFVVTVVQVWTAPALSALEVKDVETSHHVYGPVHEAAYYPGETLWIRWRVAGEMPQQTNFNYEVSYKLLDANQKVLFLNTLSTRGRFWSGTEPFYAISLKLREDLPPGRYAMECKVEDKAHKSEAAFTREFEVKPVELALASATFSHDKEGKIPAPLAGMLYQRLYFSVMVLGEDRSQGKVDLEFRVQILSRDLKDVIFAFSDSAVIQDPNIVRDRGRHPIFNGQLRLDRVGQFMLRVILADNASGQTARLDFPLTVRAPMAGEE